MASPFLPHNDIRNSEWLLNQKINYNPGYTFLIPLWWAKNYKPGTAFLSSPAKNEQQLYIEQQDILPKFDNDKDNKHTGTPILYLCCYLYSFLCIYLCS